MAIFSAGFFLEKYNFMSRQLCLFHLRTPVDEQWGLAGTSRGSWWALFNKLAPALKYSL